LADGAESAQAREKTAGAGDIFCDLGAQFFWAGELFLRASVSEANLDAVGGLLQSNPT
jgi:hypothetical protein